MGKHDCGFCKIQKNIIDRKYFAYSIKKSILGKFKTLDKDWVSAEESARINKEALREIDTLYKKGKILPEEYSKTRNDIISSIISAEEMSSPQFKEISNKFEFVYRDDPNKEHSEYAKRIFKEYEGTSYPMLVKQRCKAKVVDGFPTKGHCKEEGAIGVNKIISYDVSESGNDPLAAFDEIIDILQGIREKYRDTSDEANAPILNEIEQRLSEYTSNRDRLLQSKRERELKSLKKAAKKESVKHSEKNIRMEKLKSLLIE